MTVYAIAQITVHDRERYNRYVAGFMGVLAKYEGRLLAADERPEILEGQWGHQKVILLEFADKAALREWAESPEYKEISKDRLAATDGVVLTVRGLA